MYSGQSKTVGSKAWAGQICLLLVRSARGNDLGQNDSGQTDRRCRLKLIGVAHGDQRCAFKICLNKNTLLEYGKYRIGCMYTVIAFIYALMIR